MGLQGSLHDMAIADLIQHNCQDRKIARLCVHHDNQQAIIFFKNGNVVHATLDNSGREGEEVIYHILGWDEGSFTLESGIESSAETIQRSWSSLLLEGARLLDESRVGTDIFSIIQPFQPEVSQMAQKLDDILKEMSTDVSGYVSSIVAGMDGLNIAQHSLDRANPETISAQLTLLVKLVDTSVGKLKAGELEDELVTTERNYVLMRYLPGKQYFLGMAIDRKASNLGNLRLMSRIYADRISKAMPR